MVLLPTHPLLYFRNIIFCSSQLPLLREREELLLRLLPEELLELPLLLTLLELREGLLLRLLLKLLPDELRVLDEPLFTRLELDRVREEPLL